MERLYRDDEWTNLASVAGGSLDPQGQSIPYVVFPNEDDVTTGKPDQLAARLESVLGQPRERYRQE